MVVAVVVVAFSGILMSLAMVFAQGDQAERVAGDADIALAAESVITAGAVARANLGVTLVLTDADSQGVASETDVEASIDGVVRSLTELENRLVTLDTLSGELRVAEARVALGVTVTAAVDALRSGRGLEARRATFDDVLPAFDEVFGVAADVRQDALQRMEAERTWAGTLSRMASWAVALLVPALALLVYRAVARRRQRQTELEAELRRERDLVRAKDDLITSLSHELRTPLTSIFGFAVLLDDAMVDPGSVDVDMVREVVSMVVSEASELTRLTEDLLAAAGLDRGELAYVIEPFSVEGEIYSAVEVYLRRGMEIRVECDPAMLSVDALRFRHVIRNLVSNAEKHGAGPFRILGGMHDGSYRLEVCDRGLGVPAELQDHMFRRFVHDGEQPVLTGSVGLGLYVARRLAEGMGGSLEYSRAGDETVFAVSLPGVEDVAPPGAAVA